MPTKDIIIQEGGSAKILEDVAKIKTFVENGDYCYWVPEDSVRLTTLNVNRDGRYAASDSGYYGFSEVVVSGVGTTVIGDVITKNVEIESNGSYSYKAVNDGHYGYSIVNINVNVNHSTSTDPVSGEDIDTRPDPETGIKTDTVLPYMIVIGTMPNKTVYKFGDEIDYTGIEVYAYLKSRQKWENESYPGGRIPFDELILPTVEAGDYSDDSSTATPGGSIIDPSVQGVPSAAYKASGEYTVTDVGSINDIMVNALAKLGTERSGMSSGDIAALFSDYEGTNPAIVAINTEVCKYDGVLMSIYVFTEIVENSVVTLGRKYPCKIFNIYGRRVEDGGTVFLSSGISTTDYVTLFVGGKYTDSVDLRCSIVTQSIDYDISNLNSWSKYAIPSGTVINYLGNVNSVHCQMQSGSYERLYYEIEVEQDTDYIFSYAYIGYAFTERNGTNHKTYVYVLNSPPTSSRYIAEDWSGIVIEKARTYDSGYYEIEFNSGSLTKVYLCIDWAAVTDGETIDVRYYDLMIIKKSDAPEPGPDPSPDPGGESGPIDPTNTIVQNIRVGWKRIKDFKELHTSFPITVTTRKEGDWEGQ